MAINYKKDLKTITVKVHGVNDPYVVADTVAAQNASYALKEFNAGHKMKLVTNDGDVYVPYGSVEYVLVADAQSGTITRPDPYCAG